MQLCRPATTAGTMQAEPEMEGVDVHAVENKVIRVPGLHLTQGNRTNGIERKVQYYRVAGRIETMRIQAVLDFHDSFLVIKNIFRGEKQFAGSFCPEAKNLFFTEKSGPVGLFLGEIVTRPFADKIVGAVALKIRKLVAGGKLGDSCFRE